MNCEQPDPSSKPAAVRPALSVIIISYNTRAMTLECLATLFAVLEHDKLDAEVWLVDNASQDGSVEAVRQTYPSVHVIANAHNAGFGAANNQAMRQAAGRYFLLLNSDAFPKPGALRAMVTAMEAEPGEGALPGVVGPRLLNRDGSLQRSCWPFPTPLRSWMETLGLHRLSRPGSRWDGGHRWLHDEAREVDFVIGACLLVRREMYETVGGFDERFAMYAEETDWQRRIRDAGWTVRFTPVGEVVHYGGGSGGMNRPRVRQQFYESLDRYFLKHHGRAGWTAMRLAMITAAAVRTPCWALAWLLRPRRRAAAASKLRLQLWLLGRQLTQWRVAPTAEGAA